MQEIDEIKATLSSKGSDELLLIWRTNDRYTYTDKAFKAINDILTGRGVTLPVQSPQPVKIVPVKLNQGFGGMLKKGTSLSFAGDELMLHGAILPQGIHVISIIAASALLLSINHFILNNTIRLGSPESLIWALACYAVSLSLVNVIGASKLNGSRVPVCECELSSESRTLTIPVKCRHKTRLVGAAIPADRQDVIDYLHSNIDRLRKRQ
jgi:hypothetical protein